MAKYKVKVKWRESRIYICENTFNIDSNSKEEVEKTADAIRLQCSDGTEDSPRNWGNEEKGQYSEELKEIIKDEILKIYAKKVNDG